MHDPHRDNAPTLAQIRAAFRMMGLPDGEDDLRDSVTPPWPSKETNVSETSFIVRSNSSSPTRLPDGCYA